MQLVEFSVVVKSNTPCVQPRYKTPEAVEDKTENEIAKLFKRCLSGRLIFVFCASISCEEERGQNKIGK